MERKVSPEMNAELIKPYIAVEVLQALKEMHPNKTLGPDGQQLNREKIAMGFSANVDQNNRQAIMNLWCSTQVQQYDKYLGLPHVVGRSKSRAFAGIKHKVWLKLQGWKINMFSQGGREILLKAVALEIPSYAMSCFKIPTKLCSKIESMMARY
ncbi:hypothetical protein F2P56_024301 [Juglans regia]|uniref:Uncharacterized protein n=2 Tax=Juglans regia TaxID=51240 RepID=A0A833UBR9_JUGRE|nr:uncharacterized protein LOC109003365 [Juglans regia]KAF5454653.1 hypothetical protein F2P56_024301 [Juglans regia]